MKIETMCVSDLVPAPYNPRRISAEAMQGLSASIERFGVVEPIIYNARTKHIVGGHQRREALIAKGIKETQVVVVELPETEERALNVALNNPHIAGEFIEEDLRAILEQLQDEDANLYDALRFDPLLESAIEKIEEDTKNASFEGETDEEDVPEVDETDERVQVGEIWGIGDHRLICGDSTSVANFSRLLGSDKVDSLVTDPPYGVDYSSKNEMLNEFDKGNRVQKPIENDNIKDYRKWFSSWLSLVPWNEYATFYICMSNQEMHSLRLAIDDCKYKWGDYLVWVKNNHVLGRRDYNSKCEMILYGWPKKHKFHATEFRTSVLEYDRPQKNDLHPTMKPVKLIEQLVRDGSPGGGRHSGYLRRLGDHHDRRADVRQAVSHDRA